MRSIERRFKNIEAKNPYWSSYVCFFMAIEKQNFSQQMIARWFNKLVDKDDYSSKEKKAVLAHLYDCSNPSEDNQK